MTEKIASFHFTQFYGKMAKSINHIKQEFYNFRFSHVNAVSRLCNIARSCWAEQVIPLYKVRSSSQPPPDLDKSSLCNPNLQGHFLLTSALCSVTAHVAFPVRHTRISLVQCVPFSHQSQCYIKASKSELLSCCFSPRQNNYTFTTGWMRNKVVLLVFSPLCTECNKYDKFHLPLYIGLLQIHPAVKNQCYMSQMIALNAFLSWQYI